MPMAQDIFIGWIHWFDCNDEHASSLKDFVIYSDSSYTAYEKLNAKCKTKFRFVIRPPPPSWLWSTVWKHTPSPPGCEVLFGSTPSPLMVVKLWMDEAIILGAAKTLRNRKLSNISLTLPALYRPQLPILTTITILVGIRIIIWILKHLNPPDD